jgi:glucosamine--fructose-6-phosphate aminotransferase (isomerizing)
MPDTVAAQPDVLLRDIREQPAALERLLTDGFPAIAEAAARIEAAAPRIVRLVGHGTSGNAAAFATHAFGQLASLAAYLDSISLSRYEQVDLPVRDTVVVGVSQSGHTPDVVDFVVRQRERGALAIAVTNDSASPLAGAADAVVGLCAGPEGALASTKTYTTSLAALALLAGVAGGRGDTLRARLSMIADLTAGTLGGLERTVREATPDFRDVAGFFAIADGAEIATARESALKLTETCKLTGAAMSGVEFQHGPVVAAGPRAPVLAVVSRGGALPSVMAAAARAAAAGAPLVAAGDTAASLASLAAGDAAAPVLALPTPPAPDPLLAPLLSILPAQLFAWALAECRGISIDDEAQLTKVTYAS